MAITTICSGCSKTLAVADEHAGRQARCPACGTIYTVPNRSADVANATPGVSNNPIDRFPGSPYAGSAPIDSLEPIDLDQPDIEPDNAPTIAPIGEATSPDSRTSPDTYAATNASGGLRSGLSSDQATAPYPASASSSNASASAGSGMYWMRAANGAEYGPVDLNTLNRWFSEGRVGHNYMIRAGRDGAWQVAASFQPAVQPASNINPFASPAAAPVPGHYTKSDQSGIILALGILSWFGFCPIFGTVAWALGSQVLADMDQGVIDPTNRSFVQAGYYLGMINVVLWVCCIGLLFVGAAISTI